MNDTKTRKRSSTREASGSKGVALVTGGARRVGRAIVLALAESGYDIALHFRTSRKEAEKTARDVKTLGRRCELIQADLANESTWRDVVDHAATSLGRLDVLVNNASEFDPRSSDERNPRDEFKVSEWERLYRVNATAPAALCHFARPYLEAHGNGRIINLCDIAAEQPWPTYLSYCCSKAALVALTRGLARLYAPKILVNGIAPGIAEFPESYSANLRKKLVEQVPLKRPGTPGEVATLARYLACEGSYITGQIIAIDGGRSIA